MALQKNQTSKGKETDLEVEEKRLLESFHLHELESKKGHREADNNQHGNIGDSGLDKENHESIVQSKVLLKEGELLDGTFGDPNKLPRRDFLDYSQKSDEENGPKDDQKSKTVSQIRHEPGPAFTNSSYQEGGVPNEEEHRANIENPFYWADNPGGDNMAKLVRYIH